MPEKITYEQFLENKLNQLESFSVADFATKKMFIDSILNLDDINDIDLKDAPGYEEGYDEGHEDGKEWVKNQLENID